MKLKLCKTCVLSLTKSSAVIHWPIVHHCRKGHGIYSLSARVCPLNVMDEVVDYSHTCLGKQLILKLHNHSTISSAPLNGYKYDTSVIHIGVNEWKSASDPVQDRIGYYKSQNVIISMLWCLEEYGNASKFWLLSPYYEGTDSIKHGCMSHWTSLFELLIQKWCCMKMNCSDGGLNQICFFSVASLHMRKNEGEKFEGESCSTKVNRNFNELAGKAVKREGVVFFCHHAY